LKARPDAPVKGTNRRNPLRGFNASGLVVTAKSVKLSTIFVGALRLFQKDFHRKKSQSCVTATGFFYFEN
jgi:hypothetical protein